jgi:hypothetical protein
VRCLFERCSFVLLLALSSCAGPTPADTSVELVSERGLITARVDFAGPIVRGDNELLVELRAMDGSAQPRLLAVSALMVAHTHRAQAAEIATIGSGFRVERLNLFMTGRWQLELELGLDATADSVSLPVDVP